ncbi:MAG: hypothetical protein ACRD3L_13520 [Terriglobales bacterium]
MTLRPEYDVGMSRLNRATVAAFGMALATLLSTSMALAQIHGAPPSVTSMGFGGHPFSGISPSVTSLGPHGYTSGPAFTHSRPWFGVPPAQSFGRNRPHHRPRYSRGGVGYYAVPYYGYYGGSDYDTGSDAQNYMPEEDSGPGPTVFDRRGGYVAPPPVERREEARSPAPEAEPEPSTPTVLVCKDGHQLEVANYAIVGNTLYDLTEGHRRKVALSDLDLTATSKENDDRGVDFNLPAGSEAN